MIELRTIRDIAIVGFSLAIVFLVVEILIGDPFVAIEIPMHDALERGALNENTDIVLVDLDEESVMALGDSVYWSYLWLPQVIDKLGEAKAIAVILPVSSPVNFAPSSLERLYAGKVDSLSKWFRLAPERIAEILDSLVAGDDPGARLNEAIRSVGRVYLGFTTLIDPHTDRILAFDAQVKQSIDSLKANTAILVAEDYLAPSDSLIYASEGVGFINVAYSEDGFVRAIPLVALCKDKVYTSLALTVLRAMEGFEDVDLPNSKLLKLGEEDFLLGDGYYYRIHYTSGLDDFLRIPVSALRAGSIPPETFADKIVFIGSSVEPYSLNVPTPVDGDMPRMVVQANLLSNLLERTQASPPNIVVTFIITLIVSLLGAFAVMVPWRKFTFPGFLVILALFYIIVATSAASGVRIAFFTPLVSAVLAMIAGYLIYYFTEGRKLTYIRQMVRHYFPAEQEKHYMERFLDLPYIKLNRESVVVAVNLAFEKKEKSLQEALKSFEEFRTKLLGIIRIHGGMRMSFLGNSSLFLFSGKDCYAQALKASLEIRRYFTNFNARYETEGIAEFKLGVGMASGETFVSTLGKIPLVDLTVFGDPVLLARELAILNFELKTRILIEENLYAKLPPEAKVKELGELEIVGDNHVVYEYLR